MISAIIVVAQIDNISSKKIKTKLVAFPKYTNRGQMNIDSCKRRYMPGHWWETLKLDMRI